MILYNSYSRHIFAFIATALISTPAWPEPLPESAQTSAPPPTNEHHDSPPIIWNTTFQLLELDKRTPDKAAFAKAITEQALNPANTMSDQARYEGLMHAQSIWWNKDMHQDAAMCSDAAMRLDVDPGRHMRAAEWSGRSWQRIPDPERAFQSFNTCFELAQQQLRSRLATPSQSNADRDNIIKQSREYTGMIAGFLISNAFQSDHDDEAFRIIDALIASPTYSDFWRTNTLLTAGQRAILIERTKLGVRYYQTLLDEFPDWGVDDGEQISVRMQLLKARGHDLLTGDPTALKEIESVIHDDRFKGTIFWLWPINEACRYLEHHGQWQDAVSLNLWAIDLLRARIDTLPDDNFMATMLRDRLIDQYLFIASTCERNGNKGMAKSACELALKVDTQSDHLRSKAQTALERYLTHDPEPLPQSQWIPLTSN